MLLQVNLRDALTMYITIHIWQKTLWLQISVEWLYMILYNTIPIRICERWTNLHERDCPTNLVQKFQHWVVETCKYLLSSENVFVYCIRLTNPVQNLAHKNLYCYESWTMQMWLKKRGGLNPVLIAPIPYLSQAVNHLCCTMNYHLLHL